MMVDVGMVDTVVDLRLLRALAPMVLEYQNMRVRMGVSDSGVMFG